MKINYFDLLEGIVEENILLSYIDLFDSNIIREKVESFKIYTLHFFTLELVRNFVSCTRDMHFNYTTTHLHLVCIIYVYICNDLEFIFIKGISISLEEYWNKEKVCAIPISKPEGTIPTFKKIVFQLDFICLHAMAFEKTT